MKITAWLLAALLAIGVALAAWLAASGGPGPYPATPAGPDADFDGSAGVEARIRALEQAVAEERDARRLLEDELQALYAEVSALTEEQEGGRAGDPGRPASSQDARTRIESLRASRSSPEGRANSLIEAGFAPDRAEWIVQREAQLQMDAMQARFEARRSGESVDPYDTAFSAERALREEIGDDEYERYLTASNRSTSVAVGMVLESSPGQAAGLQPGDEILRYDGERVFNTWDLTRETMLGEPGETVVVDILREGIPMQMVVPRGPIGITTGRRSRPR